MCYEKAVKDNVIPLKTNTEPSSIFSMAFSDVFTSAVINYSPTKNTVEYTQLFYNIKSARTYFTTDKIYSVLHRTYANRYVFIPATRKLLKI